MNKKYIFIILIFKIINIHAQCEKNYIQKMKDILSYSFYQKDTWDKRIDSFIKENPASYEMYFFEKDTFASIVHQNADSIIQKLTFELPSIISPMTKDTNVILYIVGGTLSNRIKVRNLLPPRYSINTNYAEQPPIKIQIKDGSYIVRYSKIYIIPNNDRLNIRVKAGYDIRVSNSYFSIWAIVVCEDAMK
jgi:hypothetical protein